MLKQVAKEQRTHLNKATGCGNY